MAEAQSQTNAIIDLDWQFGATLNHVIEKGQKSLTVKEPGPDNHITVTGGQLLIEGALPDGSHVSNRDSDMTFITSDVGMNVRIETDGRLEIDGEVGSRCEFKCKKRFESLSVRQGTTIICDGDTMNIRGDVGRDCTIIHNGTGLLAISGDVDENVTIVSKGKVHVGGKREAIENNSFVLGTVRSGSSITAAEEIKISEFVESDVQLEVNGSVEDYEQTPCINIGSANVLKLDDGHDWRSTGENVSLSSTGKVKLSSALGDYNTVNAVLSIQGHSVGKNCTLQVEDSGGYIHLMDGVDEKSVLTCPDAIRVRGAVAASAVLEAPNVTAKRVALKDTKSPENVGDSSYKQSLVQRHSARERALSGDASGMRL